MASPIEFWFDFSSGYGYFAALEIDDLAAVLCNGRQGEKRRITDILSTDNAVMFGHRRVIGDMKGLSRGT